MLKSLRPITIVAVGAPLVAVVDTVVAAIAGEKPFTTQSFLIWLVGGFF
jgi:hypothetical protein